MYCSLASYKWTKITAVTVTKKNLYAKQDKPHFDCFFLFSFFWLGSNVQKIPKTILVIDAAPGCLPEFEAETLLLKIPHTLDIGLGGIDSISIWHLAGEN